MEKTKKDKSNYFEYFIVIILAVLVTAIIIIQISISNNRQLNPLETSLFSILQFIFSLGFAWVLAKISFKSQFIKSQKQFAIAAFRRIKEIDMTIERVLNRISSQMKTTDPNTYKELDVIFEIAKGTRQSIKSSIADWSDIIGEELATIEKIELLSNIEETIYDRISNDFLPNTEENQKLLEKLEQKQKEVIKLIETLPPSLQTQTKKENNKLTSLETMNTKFQKEIDKNNYLCLDGFWDETFQKDILHFKVGDILTVHQGDAGSRIGAMIAYDKEGNSVGVITNSSLGLLDYDTFFDRLISFLHKSVFDVEILEIRKTPLKTKKEERHYFIVKIL